jgi:hypothetical protein
MPTLHVRAVEGALVAAYTADGAPLANRYVGRVPGTHALLPDGETVPDLEHYRRALSRGELTAIAPKPIAPIAPRTSKETT